MKNKLFQLVFLILCFNVFSQSEEMMSARDLAESGFWQEALVKLKSVPKTEQNLDYKLLKAFANVMTNQSSSEDEEYIMQNASLENKLNLLVRQKKYEKAIEIGEKALQQDVLSSKEKYLLGLSYLGVERYEDAENFLGEDSVFALFYKAYSQYVQGKIKESLANFQKTSKIYPAHKMGIESHIYAAKCSILQNDFETAIKEGLFAINKSTDLAQRVEASLLVANLYQDMKKLDSAISLLKPYSNNYDGKTIPLKFKLSEIYIIQGKKIDADNILRDIQNFYSGTEYAEEAAYKRGKLYFDDENYLKAREHFSYCENNFPNGNFAEQAIYYKAFSTEKIGQIDEAVLQYLKILSIYNNSSYVYYAHERLANLFYNQSEYERALYHINFIQENYSEESAFSNLNNLKPQIELLILGENKDTVELLQQWNKNKKASTLDGMKIGLELAGKYLSSVEDAQKGVGVLQEILGKIDENTTSYEKANIAAQGNTLLGLHTCMNANYVEGSEYYLKAASFFMGINEDKAAESMYKAAVALSNAKKYQDVRLVYNKMQTLYSTSPWTEKAQKLLGR